MAQTQTPSTQVVRSIQDCLNDYAYDEIFNNYSNLTEQDANLILNHCVGNFTQNTQSLIRLINKKVIPVLKYVKYEEGKRRIAQLKQAKSHQVTKSGAELTNVASHQMTQLGFAYKILGDCYSFIGDIENAVQFYNTAEKYKFNCSQELSIVIQNNPTPKFNAIIEKADKLKGRTFKEKSLAISEYASSIVDGILQLSVVPLSNDVYNNLRNALSIYLRNEIAGLGLLEEPPMQLISGAFEVMLKELFYVPYAKFLDDNLTSNATTIQRLRSKGIPKARGSLSEFRDGITLGDMQKIIVESVQNGVYQIDQTFYNFIISNYNMDTSIFGSAEFIGLIKFIDSFRASIRNPAGHGIVMYKQTFEQVCEELLLKDDCWVNRIIKATDLDYLDENGPNGSGSDSDDGSSGSGPDSSGGGDGSSGSGGGPSGTGRSGNSGKDYTSLISRMVDDNIFNIDKFIEELKNFVEKTGNYPNINSSNKKEKILAKKVYTIRLWTKNNSKVKLTAEDIQKLDEIDFVWEGKIDWFNNSYNNLMKYKNEHGNLDMPHDYINEEGMHLGQQIRMLREKYKTGELTPEQRLALDNLSFKFEESNTNIKWFNNFYDELVEYKKTHKDFKGVLKDKNLGPKVKEFILNYNNFRHGRQIDKVITRGMLLKLKNIGFTLKDVLGLNKDKEEEYDFTL